MKKLNEKKVVDKMKNKILIGIIILVYGTLLFTILYYRNENKERKENLENKVLILEQNLISYYEVTFNKENSLGKLFVFPGETDIEFDDNNIMSGEAFIYLDGKYEIALYDGKFCATKSSEKKLEIKKESISSCIVNKG